MRPIGSSTMDSEKALLGTKERKRRATQSPAAKIGPKKNCLALYK
jgi:hypothetical protein